MNCWGVCLAVHKYLGLIDFNVTYSYLKHQLQCLPTYVLYVACIMALPVLQCVFMSYKYGDM